MNLFPFFLTEPQQKVKCTSFFHSLPQIVSTFHGPVDLCTAVRDQVEAWQLLGLIYFSAVSEDEIQTLENALNELKEKR